MKPYALMIALGIGLIAVAGALGGRAAAIGGTVALGAQIWAVALLRPGMGIRFLALGALLVWAATQRTALAPLPAALGFLGVLLPLLFLETRFLR